MPIIRFLPETPKGRIAYAPWVFSVGNECLNHLPISLAIRSFVPFRGRLEGVCDTPLQPNGRHVLDLAMIFFSCLDTRKEAKEDQGLTEAGEVSRIHDRS